MNGISTEPEYVAQIDSSLAGGAGTVRVIRSLEQIEEIRPAWTTWRGHRDADIDIYLTVLRCSVASATPYIIVIERQGQPDAMLLGIATTTTLKVKIAYLTISVSKVRLLTFVYGGFLGNQSVANSELIVDEVGRWLRRGDADVALLGYVRSASPLHDLARHRPSLLMRDHFPVTQAHWLMDLPPTLEAIYAGVSRDHRKRLRSEAKKFQAAFPDSLRISRFESPGELDQLIRDAEQVAATTYQRGLSVGFSDTRQIRELLALEARKGWLRGYVLYAAGRPCAFWIGCVYNDVFLSEYLGHDPAYAKYSPGTYVLVRGMEDLCRHRVKSIDLGIGEALYKQRFGNCKCEESTIYLFAPTFKGMQVKGLRTIASLINQTAKRVLQRTALLSRLKKLWRSHLIRSTEPTSVR